MLLERCESKGPIKLTAIVTPRIMFTYKMRELNGIGRLHNLWLMKLWSFIKNEACKGN